MVTYTGKRVLVTGGYGFVGSNLSIRLVQLGAEVTIVDALVKGCGGNRCNIDRIAGKVRVIEADIGDAERFRSALCNIDVVFNLAGEISHTHSIEFPERDLNLNTRSQMEFLTACARQSKGVRVVYAGTRQVYGKPLALPVSEFHPIAPVDFNGVHKHATELYHLMLTRAGAIDAVVLRFSNVYGPRLGINAPCQGVLSTFILNLVMGRRIEVFGDGTQIRDPLYVDDAVNALLRAGAERSLKSRIYNVGGREPLTLSQIARILCATAGADAPTLRPFPVDRARIDIGSFVSDTTLIRRELGWSAATSFEEGAAATLRFFRNHLRDYVKTSGEYPRCSLHQPLSMMRGAAVES